MTARCEYRDNGASGEWVVKVGRNVVYRAVIPTDPNARTPDGARMEDYIACENRAWKVANDINHGGGRKELTIRRVDEEGEIGKG